MSAERQPVKSFTRYSASDGVRISHSEGDPFGDVTIQWPVAGSRPLLIAWRESWRTLMACGDVIAWLASVEGKDVTPAEVCAALASMGYVDMTPAAR